MAFSLEKQSARFFIFFLIRGLKESKEMEKKMDNGYNNLDFPGVPVVKNPPASAGQEDPRRRAWQPTPVFLPGESHAQRSLAGSSP